tara:strand:+ start:226 stop:918 length:693 start_codon:yes stop_codon:yes gene_type:complete
MTYGKSELSVIPMRNLADDKSEMINQILFGEYFKVLSKKQDWSKVELAHDQYTGWICNKQWKEISEKEYLTLNEKEDNFSYSMISKHKNINIFRGSIISSKDKKNTKKDLISLAKDYLETPYLWGGRTPFGIDCSGFTQIIFRLIGIKIARDAYQQAEVGRDVNSINKASQGDLAFFKSKSGNITHVGIIIDKNKIIHASGKVRIDFIDNKGILTNNQYSHSLDSIKTMF